MPARARRPHPARALRGRDRRADGARLLHGHLVPHRVPARRRARSRELAHERGALSSPTATRRSARSRARRARRSAPTSSPAGPSSTCSARRGSPSCACGRARSSELLPTQTGWFADEDIFAMDISDYSPHSSARRFDSGTPPVPTIYPGVAGMESSRRPALPAIEAHVRGLVDACSPGSTSSARRRHAARPASAAR